MVATEVKLRRGTNAQHSSFTGAQGELTYVTDDKNLRIHDALTAGGLIIPNKSDSIENAFNYGTVTGTADALILTLTPAILSYVVGQIFYIKIASNNTTTAVINISTLGNKTIKKDGGGSNLAANDLVAGSIIVIMFDGTDFQVVGGMGSSGSAVSVFSASGTWTKPSGLASVFVEMVGGGGGGGGGNGTTGGDGGGAGYAAERHIASALGSTETVTVGAAGAAGTVFGNGGAGGTSSFGSLTTAPGGGGGLADGTIGVVGVPTTGVINKSGKVSDSHWGVGAGSGELGTGGLGGTNGVAGNVGIIGYIIVWEQF